MTRLFDLANHAGLDAILALKSSPRVTSFNDWRSDKWRIDGSIPGHSDAQFTIHFDVAADRRVIDELKWLTALLFIGRHGQRSFKHSSAGVYSAGVRHLARYMKQNDHRSFATLDRDAFDEFRDAIHQDLVDPEDRETTAGDLRADEVDEDDLDEADLDELVRGDGVEPMPPADEGDDDAGGVAKAYNRLRIWKLLWEHRDVMREAGIRPVAFNPFATQSATDMARTLARKAADEIPALPDEVALPVLAGAVRMIGTPAADVIALQSVYLSCMQRMDRQPPTAERQVIRDAMQAFEFGTVMEEATPWREPIVLSDEEVGGGDALAELIDTIRAACLIVIMGFTGVRISEAVSPEVEPRIIVGDTLPSCVTVEDSKSGLSDLYMLHGLLSKGQDVPKPDSWLLGARPRLAPKEPPAVRAVRVLELLYAPWREFASDALARRRLFTGFVNRGLPRDRGSVVTVRSQRLRQDMKDFVADERYVDLSGLREAAKSKPLLAPYAAKPRRIRTHQWRKTYMRYVMRTDPAMAPAVSQHFKHMTVALTERDYGPKDAAFLQQADSVRARSTGVALRAILEGKTRPITRLDKAIALAADQWKSLVPDGGDEDPFVALAIDQDLRIWHADHGRCLIGVNPDEARCHERAGTAGWRHAQPNRLTRTPTLCTGCANFSLHAGSASFWRRRYLANQGAWEAAGGEVGFEIIRRRAEQAAKFLLALGEEPPATGRGGAA